MVEKKSREKCCRVKTGMSVLNWSGNFLGVAKGSKGVTV